MVSNQQFYEDSRCETCRVREAKLVYRNCVAHGPKASESILIGSCEYKGNCKVVPVHLCWECYHNTPKKYC